MDRSALLARWTIPCPPMALSRASATCAVLQSLCEAWRASPQHFGAPAVEHLFAHFAHKLSGHRRVLQGHGYMQQLLQLLEVCSPSYWANTAATAWALRTAWMAWLAVVGSVLRLLPLVHMEHSSRTKVSAWRIVRATGGSPRTLLLERRSSFGTCWGRRWWEREGSQSSLAFRGQVDKNTRDKKQDVWSHLSVLCMDQLTRRQVHASFVVSSGMWALLPYRWPVLLGPGSNCALLSN